MTLCWGNLGDESQREQRPAPPTTGIALLTGLKHALHLAVKQKTLSGTGTPHSAIPVVVMASIAAGRNRVTTRVAGYPVETRAGDVMVQEKTSPATATHQGDAMSTFIIVIAWLFGLGAIQTDTQTGTTAGCPPRDYAVPDTAHSYGL